MKILLISGHGAGDCGAIGNGYKEADLTRELVKLIDNELKYYEVDIDIYDQKRNAYKDVKNGTFHIRKYDYVFEVHFNAYDKKAHGTEIWVTKLENGISVEQEIVKNLSQYFTDRGVKRENFAVIYKCRKLGISGALLETCFIDNASDMKIYQTKKKAIAKAIAIGIAEKWGLKKKATPTIKTVQVNSKVKIKSGAVYGGLASTRGKKVPESVIERIHTIKKIQTNKGVQEALLKEINSWVAVSSLTVI